MPNIAAQKLILTDKTWQLELGQCVTDPQELLDLLNIDSSQFKASFGARKLFPVRVPRPFIARIEPGNIDDPLLKQVMTSANEFIEKEGFINDPLGEHGAKLPGLLHKYESRVLIMVRTACAINCRYCFRREFPYQDNSIGTKEFKEIASYVQSDRAINEVILSGGDPLMASDSHLEKLIALFEPVKHITRLRIHTRLPVVIPSRITQHLTQILKNSRLDIVMVFHINHANEIDTQVQEMAKQLRAIDVTLLNQAVMLRDINDDLASQVRLNERLFSIGVLPYYLHLLDKVKGATHFDIEEEKAIALMHQLYQKLPGFLVPRLVREIGGQAHKTPIDLGLAPVL